MEGFLTDEIMQRLREPFPPEEVHFKPQTKPNDKGQALAAGYVDARSVIERLNAVVGPDWGDSYQVEPSVRWALCDLTIQGVTRSDIGTDNVTEPEKSAVSDALKRAAVKFGIGIDLYYLPKMWATVANRGGYDFLPDEEIKRLREVYVATIAGEPELAKNLARQAPRAAQTAKPPEQPRAQEVRIVERAPVKGETRDVSPTLTIHEGPPEVRARQQNLLRPFQEAAQVVESLHAREQKFFNQPATEKVTAARKGLLASKLLAVCGGSADKQAAFLRAVWPTSEGDVNKLNPVQVRAALEWLDLAKDEMGQWGWTDGTQIAEKEAAVVIEGQREVA